MTPEHTPDKWPDTLAFSGRTLFAIGLFALGIEHFIFQDFIMGRAPAWPESVPGRIAWAYLSGGIFVTSAVAILLARKGRHAALLVAVLVFLWAFLRHIPAVATGPLFSGEWTNAGKALRLFGGVLAVAAVLPREAGNGRSLFSGVVNLDRKFVDVARFCMGPTLILNGIQHFLFTPFVASLIPGWFPGQPEFWTWFGGIALIAGGLGLLISRTARLAALLSGIMVFSWFFIVHLTREIAGVADGIAVFEALLTAGILFTMAGFLYKREKTNHT